LRRKAGQLARAWNSEGTESFPIVLRAAELARFIRERRRPGQEAAELEDSTTWLLEFLSMRNRELGWGLDTDFFRPLLKSSSTTVLIDGLDQAINRVEREIAARMIESATHAFENARFIVSTRPEAYTGQSVLAGFVQAHVQPLSPEAARQFLE